MEVETQVWLTNPTADPREWYFAAYSGDMATQGWFKVKDATVYFDRPSRDDVIPKTVENLRDQQTAIRAEAGKRINHIENQISKLLSIGYDGGSATLIFPVNLDADASPDDDIPF